MSVQKTHPESPLPHSLQAEQGKPHICIIELVRCKNTAGKSFFAYIRLNPSEYQEYRAKFESGEPVNPNEYEILEYGWGDDPPAHLQDLMEEKYGVDHDFEKKIQKLLEQAVIKTT